MNEKINKTPVQISILSFSFSFFRIVSLVITNKVLAVYCGPADMLYSETMSNSIAILSALAGGMLATASSKFLAEEKTKEKINQLVVLIVWTSFILSLILSVIVILLLLLGLNIFSSSLTLLTMLAIFPAALGVLGPSILSGLHMYSRSLIINFIWSLISPLFIGLGAVYYGIDGAVVGLIFSHLLYGLINLSIVGKISGIKTLQKPKDICKTLQLLFSFSKMTALSLISIPTSQFLIRSMYEVNYGKDMAGIWQTVMRVSELMLTPYLMIISAFLIPALSKAKMYSEANELIKQIQFICFSSSLIGISIFYVYSDFFIKLLFSEEFLIMNQLLFWQLLATIIRVVGIVYSSFLLSKNMQWQYILSELLALFVFIFGTIYLLYFDDLNAATKSFFASNVLYLVLVMYLKNTHRMSS